MRGKIEHPLHDPLAFLGRDFIQLLAASDGDQHEQAPAHDGKAGAQQFVDGRQIVGSLFGDERVDLDGNAETSAMACRFHGALKGSGDVANVVVAFGAGTVKAQAHTLDPMRFQFRDGVVGQLIGGGGSDGNFQAKAVGVVDQFIDIFAVERIAASQNDVRQWIAEFQKLVEEFLALFGAEFQRIGVGHGLSATVFAGESASLGHFPVDEHWIFREVVRRHAANIWSIASDYHDVPLSATEP